MSSDSLRIGFKPNSQVEIQGPEGPPPKVSTERLSEGPALPPPPPQDWMASLPKAKNLWEFFNHTLAALPRQDRSDLTQALSQLKKQLPEAPTAKLSGQVELISYLEGIENWVEGLDKLDVPNELKNTTVRWAISGALTGQETMIQQGLAQGQELENFSRLKVQRAQTQDLFAKLYPQDIRLGRAEANYIGQNAFLKSLQDSDPEVRKYIHDLLQEGAQNPQPKSRRELQRQIAQWQALYHNEKLQILLQTYENTQTDLLGKNSHHRRREILNHALERMDRYDTDLSVLAQVKAQLFTETVTDSDSLFSTGQSYREDLLKSAESIETELAAALDLAELEQDAARWDEVEASQALEEGEPDEPVAEVRPPDSPEVVELRTDLVYFQALRQEIESIDFLPGSDLAQSLEELESAAREYNDYESAWVHQEILGQSEGVLRVDRAHRQSKELWSITERVESQDRPSAQDYRDLLDTIETAALWTTVEARIVQYGEMHQSAWLTDGIIAAGQELGESALYLAPLTSILAKSKVPSAAVDGASPYAQMESEYLQVLALLSQNKPEEARRRFVRLETSNEHALLVENFKDSQTFNQCTLNAGIVIASAGIGEIFAVAAVRTAPALNITRGLGVTRFTANAAAFTGVSHGLSQASMGHDYFDPRLSAGANAAALSEEFLLNMGMFYFLGRSQKLFQSYANRALVKLAERRVAQSALGKSMVSQEAQGALAVELENLGKSGLVQGGMRLGSFATELAGFGVWDMIHMNYEDLKSGHFNPVQNLETSLLNPEAWQDRFIFLIALKAGGILVSPLTKPLHQSVQQWAMAGHREKLDTYQTSITEAQGALEKFLTQSQGDRTEFPQLVSAYRRALEKQGNLLESIPELGNAQTQALNRVVLKQLKSFEASFEAHRKIFGAENVYGIEVRAENHVSYAPRKTQKLLAALETFPGLQELNIHDNGLIEVRLIDPLTNQLTTTRLAPQGATSLASAREDLLAGTKVNSPETLRDGLSSFFSQMAMPMPFMALAPHTLLGKWIHGVLAPKPVRTSPNNAEDYPALLNGRRPVTLVSPGKYEFAADLSRWRVSAAEGPEIILEREPPPEGITYQDQSFSGKAGNQKHLRIPFGRTDLFSPGEIWQIVSPQAVAKNPAKHQGYTLRASPSGVQVQPEPSENLVAVATAVVAEESTLVGNCNNRIVLNTQAWAEPYTPSPEMLARLQALAEKQEVTLAVKTAAPPYALEFEPASAVERQKAQGTLEAIGVRMVMSLSLGLTPTLNLPKIAGMLSGYFPWQATFDGAEKHLYQKHGIEFEYAVVDQKDLPELVGIPAAAVTFHQLNFVMAPILRDPKIKSKHRLIFQELLALHNHAIGTLDGGDLKATKLELAVAEQEGVLKPYLEFLHRNGVLQNRGLYFGHYNWSLARDLSAMGISTASFIHGKKPEVSKVQSDSIFKMAAEFKFPEDLLPRYGKVLDPGTADVPYQGAGHWGEAIIQKGIKQYVRDLAKRLMDIVESDVGADPTALQPRLNAAYAHGIQPLLALRTHGQLPDTLLRHPTFAKIWNRSMKYLSEVLKTNFGISLANDFPLLGLDLAEQVRLLHKKGQAPIQEPPENFEFSQDNIIDYIVVQYLQGDTDKISQKGRFIERSFTLPDGSRIKARQILENYYQAQGRYGELTRLMDQPGGIGKALVELREHAEYLSFPRKENEVARLINLLLGSEYKPHRQELTHMIAQQVYENKTYPLAECLKILLLMKGLTMKPEAQSDFYAEVIQGSEYTDIL